MFFIARVPKLARKKKRTKSNIKKDFTNIVKFNTIILVKNINEYFKKGCDLMKDKYDNGDLYDVSFSMINDKEYRLIINAIKRQVDYYRTKVFDNKNVLNEYAYNTCKSNYKIYKDLYNKIISDYNSVVKCDFVEL